jgi:uncharacterized protein YcfJ
MSDHPHRINAAGICVHCFAADLGLAAVRGLMMQIRAAGGDTDDVWTALDAMVATFAGNQWGPTERDAVIDQMAARVKTIFALRERSEASQQ